MKFFLKSRAQSTSEFSLVLTVVIAGIFVMAPYLRGSIQKSYTGANRYLINTIADAQQSDPWAIISEYDYQDSTRERSRYETESQSGGVNIFTNSADTPDRKIYSFTSGSTVNVIKGWSQTPDHKGGFDVIP